MWTKAEIAQLRLLSSSKSKFYTEIASEMGRSVQSVRWMARKLELPRSQEILRNRYGKWNAKHSHLREPVMRYFVTHSWDETKKKFNLTESELKSLFTVGYRDPKLAHLRKDTRVKREWNTSDLKFLLRHSGIMPREWIGKKLKRGNAHSCIKERLNKLGISSKSINGITISQFRDAFGCDPDFFIQTKAGPTRGIHGSTYWKLVPWTYLNREIKSGRLKTAESFALVIETMAIFQDWIFEGNAVKKLQAIAKSKEKR